MISFRAGGRRTVLRGIPVHVGLTSTHCLFPNVSRNAVLLELRKKPGIFRTADQTGRWP